MKQMFLIAVLLWSVAFTVNAQTLGTTTDKTFYAVPSGYKAYRVNVNPGNTQKASLVLVDFEETAYSFATMANGVVTQLPATPEKALSVSEFVVFKNKGYAFGTWPSGAYSYVFDFTSNSWQLNPTQFDGSVTLAEQIGYADKKFLLLSGAFTTVNGISYPHVCKFDGKKFFTLENNNSAVIRTSGEQGALLVTVHEPGSSDPLIQATDLSDGSALSLPAVPANFTSVTGVALTPINVIYAVFADYATGDAQFARCAIGGTTWEMLGHVGLNTQLRQQNGEFVILMGVGQSDLITTKASLYLFHISTGQFFDPFVSTTWCPAGTAFPDGEGNFGTGTLFTAWSLVKNGMPYSLAKLTFHITGLKIDTGSEKETSLSLFPNPATTSVILSGLAPGSTILIYNLTGQVVKKTNSTSESQVVPISDLQAGIYLAKVAEKEEKIKFTIVR